MDLMIETYPWYKCCNCRGRIACCKAVWNKQCNMLYWRWPCIRKILTPSKGCKSKSWSSTFPFNRRAIFIYWWAQIFRHSCRGTCADMSSPPKRRVSSPWSSWKTWVLLGILRTFGLVSDVWDRPDVCSEMSESLIICSKSTKFARGWLLVSGFAGCVGCFALPSEFEVCESGSPWFPLPNCKISTASSVPFDDLSLFPPLSTAPLPRPLRFRVFRPPGIIKINHRCLLRISNYADCFLIILSVFQESYSGRKR